MKSGVVVYFSNQEQRHHIPALSQEYNGEHECQQSKDKAGLTRVW